MTGTASVFSINHRERVQDMRPLEAVDYLLDVIEDIITPPDLINAWVIPGLHLTPQMLRVLRVLAAGNGQLVPMQVIREAMLTDFAGDLPSGKHTGVIIHKLRRGFQKAGLPLHIANVWSLGYRLHAPHDWTWPWDDQGSQA